jgi:hypothetical protein
VEEDQPAHPFGAPAGHPEGDRCARLVADQHRRIDLGGVEHGQAVVGPLGQERLAPVGRVGGADTPPVEHVQAAELGQAPEEPGVDRIVLHYLDGHHGAGGVDDGRSGAADLPPGDLRTSRTHRVFDGAHDLQSSSYRRFVVTSVAGLLLELARMDGAGAQRMLEPASW